MFITSALLRSDETCVPILPLDHPEPFAATLGVMLYPGIDDDDRRKARSFAAHWLAEPIRRATEAGHVVSYEFLLRIATDHCDLLPDLDERFWGGTATGELVKTLWALFNTNPVLVSWNNAAKISQFVAKRNKAKGSRTDLYDAKSRFLSVAHLWGAWCIREGRFVTHPDVGYDGWVDFQSFLAEAEILRDWGQTWRSERANSSPLLPSEVWRVPDTWILPAQQPGWPILGKIPLLTLPQDQLIKCRPAGRPRKGD